MFADVQGFMIERGMDGWLIFDFRGSNPVLARLLPTPDGRKRHSTRRAALWVPARGEPLLLRGALDAQAYKDVALRQREFISWQELHAALKELVDGKRIAMEYSPANALPVAGIVDAGTIELLRGFGAEVVPSADLVQVAVARWSNDAVQTHRRSSELVNGIKDQAFELIRGRLTAGQPIDEHAVVRFIMERFAASGLETPDPPIVAANAHSGDPHFEVSSTNPAPIRKGDWVLIDLWARIPGDHNIYADITWVGYAGHSVPTRHAEVFRAVAAARDASLRAAQDAWLAKRPVQGWQLDEAARKVLIGAGLASFIKHRTGHSLSPGAMVHGIGANLDNLETHDTREILPRTGFTIEPGAYLPEFGVRSEINVYVDPVAGPVPTSRVQQDVILLA